MELLEAPSYPEGFDFVDADCKFIADYLYHRVNETFYPALKTDVIKTIRYFNDPFIPLKDFPVLKVYKTGYQEDIFLAPQTSYQFTIAYALAYAPKNKISAIGSFVADEIVRLLKNGSYLNMFQLDDEKGIQVQYEDFINPENVIYKYATINVNIFSM